jgi:serine/threonine protein kinase
MSQAGHHEVAPYELLHRIGRGGMAEVWLAEWREPPWVGVPVALKRISPGLCTDPAVVRMFLRESQLALRLRHSNVVHVFDVGEVDHQPYIAMELIDGIDLYRLRNRRQTPLPLPCSVSIVCDIARALAYAHTLVDDDGTPLRIVHRDVSPSNIMVRRDGLVKLLDFGVAKVFGMSDLTRAQLVLKGKPGYMAPELIKGQPYDHRADIFAAGVVLHELITHRRLFASENEYVTLALNSACRVAAPSTIITTVSPQLDQITMRALAAAPEQRYDSAEELARDLESILVELGGWTQHQMMSLVGSQRHVTAEDASMETTEGGDSRPAPSLAADDRPTTPARPSLADPSIALTAMLEEPAPPSSLSLYEQTQRSLPSWQVALAQRWLWAIPVIAALVAMARAPRRGDATAAATPPLIVTAPMPKPPRQVPIRPPVVKHHRPAAATPSSAGLLTSDDVVALPSASEAAPARAEPVAAAPEPVPESMARLAPPAAPAASHQRERSPGSSDSVTRRPSRSSRSPGAATPPGEGLLVNPSRTLLNPYRIK